MLEPFLIAHKVCGQPAFDVAEQMDCPLCRDHAGTNYGCDECDYFGYWWIIPTSGHRAYPYQSWTLSELFWRPTTRDPFIPFTNATEGIMEKDWGPWPDHYKSGPSPKIDIKSLFRAAPKPTIPRRL